jgi:thioredoxin-related protein
MLMSVISMTLAHNTNLTQLVVKYDNFEVSKLKFAKEIVYPIYPSCLFFDQNRELVYDGVGYRNDDKFLKELKLVSSKSYNDIE